jgi:hypothetical protein
MLISCLGNPALRRGFRLHQLADALLEALLVVVAFKLARGLLELVELAVLTGR